ncbi:MAG TPA: preprotein translocase subunit SecE [Terriglobia bacterium]|nr:preprotein translocase subunit SecE [Terriglobia bacterium]
MAAEELTIAHGVWQKFRDYCREVKVEMKRVNWPSKQEVYGNTVMVLATTFAFAFFFWICDSVFSRLVIHTLEYFLHHTA